jgi:hypothetical protein
LPWHAFQIRVLALCAVLCISPETETGRGRERA